MHFGLCIKFVISDCFPNLVRFFVCLAIKFCKHVLLSIILHQTEVFQLDKNHVPVQMELLWCTVFLLSNVLFHAQHIDHMAF